MRLTFPNPFGHLPSDPKAAAELKERFGFSDAYADFLRTNNGLSFDSLGHAPAA